jgi:hypothetical protein
MTQRVRQPTIGNIAAKAATTLDSILERMDPSTHHAIREAIHVNQATAIVLYRNNDMCSSHLGESTVVCIGGLCSSQSLDSINGLHLGDVPSRFQWPIEWAPVNWVIDGRSGTEPCVNCHSTKCDCTVCGCVSMRTNGPCPGCESEDSRRWSRGHGEGAR